MCGITGIIDWSNQLSPSKREETVLSMNECIFHRGPDAAGYYSTKIATLAMRRLSIIDTVGGQQPIFNETKDISIVFNGEIYNYQSLRKQLEEKHHHFTTQSDTEVLVHLYEEYGTAMLNKLKGMFAFCICDERKKQFFIGRDKFGEKPLYYYEDKGMLSFASELKALLANPLIPRQLNTTALPYYFRTSLVPEPLTLFSNIFSLRAGHFLLVSENNCREECYFQPSYNKSISIDTEEEAIDYITPYLEQAVKRQMVSDVPIGAFLSGGIDSSTVVALLQQHSTQPINTFTVRFEEQAYDESAIARKVAKHCGTVHHEIVIPNMDFDVNLFWDIIDHVGLPFRDSSAIPSYLVSQAIAKHVKVALSGDGGDELFGGYDLFQWYQKIVGLKQMARPVRSIATKGMAVAQQTPLLKNVSILRKIKRGIQTSLAEEKEIAIALNELFPQQQVQALLSNQQEIQQSTYALLKNYPASFDNWSSLRKIMYYRLQHTLPANMLIKIDRMSMANSLEVRAPFLDADLFEASVQLPDDLLIQGGKGKYLLRKIMSPHLPKQVFDHPKMGFSIPLFKYQNTTFQNLAKRLLFEENPMPDLIPKPILERIYHRGIHLKKDTATHSVFQSAHQLWMMMMLFGWIKRFKVTL